MVIFEANSSWGTFQTTMLPERYAVVTRQVMFSPCVQPARCWPWFRCRSLARRTPATIPTFATGLDSEAVIRSEEFYETKAQHLSPRKALSSRAILSKPFANVGGFLIQVQHDQRYPATAGSRAFVGRTTQGVVCGQPKRARALESRELPACGRSQTESRGKCHDKR